MQMSQMSGRREPVVCSEGTSRGDQMCRQHSGRVFTTQAESKVCSAISRKVDNCNCQNGLFWLNTQ